MNLPGTGPHTFKKMNKMFSQKEKSSLSVLQLSQPIKVIDVLFHTRNQMTEA